MLFLNYSIHSRYIRFAKLVSKKSTCNKEKGGSLSTARSGVGKAFAPLPEQVLKVVYAVDMELVFPHPRLLCSNFAQLIVQ